MKLRVYHQNPSPTPTAQNVYVSIANERFVRRTGNELEVMEVTRGGAGRSQLPTTFPSKDGSPRTSNTRIARTNCHPRRLLPRPATVEIMITILPPVMVIATTVVAPRARGPPPLPDTTVYPNTFAVHECTTTVSTVDVYQNVLVVLIVTLVGGGMGRLRSDLPCLHAGGLSLTGFRPTTAPANEMR